MSYCLETCDECGFTWDSGSLEEDGCDCRNCEADRLMVQGIKWQEDNEDGMAEIRKFFGGYREMPVGLKHAVQMLITHCESVERRLLSEDDHD